MSRIMEGTTVSVVKFKQTGLVALCKEVVDYVDSEESREVIVGSARFSQDDECYFVTFDRVTR